MLLAREVAGHSWDKPPWIVPAGTGAAAPSVDTETQLALSLPSLSSHPCRQAHTPVQPQPAKERVL